MILNDVCRHHQFDQKKTKHDQGLDYAKKEKVTHDSSCPIQTLMILLIMSIHALQIAGVHFIMKNIFFD